VPTGVSKNAVIAPVVNLEDFKDRYAVPRHFGLIVFVDLEVVY